MSGFGMPLVLRDGYLSSVLGHSHPDVPSMLGTLPGRVRVKTL